MQFKLQKSELKQALVRYSLKNFVKQQADVRFIRLAGILPLVKP